MHEPVLCIPSQITEYFLVGADLGTLGACLTQSSRTHFNSAFAFFTQDSEVSLDKQVQLAIIGTNNFPLSNVFSPYSDSSSTVLNGAQRVFVSDPLQQLQGHDHRHALLHRRRARRNLQDVRCSTTRNTNISFLCLLLRRGVAAP